MVDELGKCPTAFATGLERAVSPTLESTQGCLVMTLGHLTGFFPKRSEPEANTGGKESGPLFTTHTLGALITDLELSYPT